VSKHYEIPVPYRALSEYELSECELKAFGELEDLKVLSSVQSGESLKPKQALNLTRASRKADYYIIFHSIRDFVEDLTFEIVTRFRGAKEFADHIRHISGIDREDEIQDF